MMLPMARDVKAHTDEGLNPLASRAGGTAASVL